MVLALVLPVAAGLTSCAGRGVPGGERVPTGQAELPIYMNFVIHFDPLVKYLPDPGGTESTREAYERERDNLAWLADYLDEIERKQGLDCVPRLTLEIGGDHAEFYAEDQEGLDLLRGLYNKGIHAFGVHFHKEYKVGEHLWSSVGEGRSGTEMEARVTLDHIREVDRLIGTIVGTSDQSEIRKVNRDITGQLLDRGLALQMGFDMRTGGQNEVMNLFFDHDVYNPWRPGEGWALSEDLEGKTVLFPQAPVLGMIGEHYPLPRGVPEEYTSGMERMIWQDNSVPGMKRKFLFALSEWSYRAETGAEPKVFTFSWLEHLNNIDGNDNARGDIRNMRDEVEEFVGWLNENYVGRSIAGGPVARYASLYDIERSFLEWENLFPGSSSFSYTPTCIDWEVYPYMLKGLAGELAFSQFAGELDAFKSMGVSAYRLFKTYGRNWGFDGGEIVCSGDMEEIYVLMAGAPTIVDFSRVFPGEVTLVAGRDGATSQADSSSIEVSTEPLVVKVDREAAR